MHTNDYSTVENKAKQNKIFSFSYTMKWSIIDVHVIKAVCQNELLFASNGQRILLPLTFLDKQYIIYFKYILALFGD